MGSFTNPPQVFINQKPEVHADSVGRFDVRLTVENALGCRDTFERKAYLRIGQAPQVDFDADPKEDCLMVDRKFTDLTKGNVDEWFWDFGDSTKSVLQNPIHNYNGFGTFDVSLLVGYNGCYALKEVPEFMLVHPPKASYKLVVDCTDPRNVQINNTSLLGDHFLWTIDGPGGQHYTTKDSTIGDFAFDLTGNVAISLLTKNDSTGCEHFTTDTFLLDLPQAQYRLDTMFGCVPFVVTIDTMSIYADSTFLFFQNMPLKQNKISIDSAGVYDSPLFVVKDANGCRDSFSLDENILGNAILTNPVFDPVVCAPDSLILIDSSMSLFGRIDSIWWSVGPQLGFGPTDTLYFTQKGVYDVKVRYKDNWQCAAETMLPQSLTVVSLKPDFRADSLGCTGASIRFVPSGNDANTNAFSWSFGDGHTSANQVGTNRYDSEGDFDVCLTMKDIRGCESEICKPRFVKIRDPHANFSAEPIGSPCPPLITNFTNLSTNAIAYEWDFGDNSGVSRNVNPSHVYSEPDTFSVSLVAIRSATCKDTFSIEDLIKLEGPKAAIEYDISGNCLPIQIHMSAESDKPYAYFWDFGNGDVDTTSGLVTRDSVTYDFTEPGIYLPKLVVQDQNGCKRIFASEAIEVNEVKADFMIEEDTVCGPETPIRLINQSTTTSSVVGYEWEVDGADWNLQSFDKDFNFSAGKSGLISAKLTVSSPNCIDTFGKDSVIEVFYLPEAMIESVESSLCENNLATLINRSTLAEGNISEWVWSVQGMVISNESEVSFIFDTAGLYPVKLWVQSEAGCVDSTLQQIEIRQGIRLNLPPDSTICLDYSLPLSAEIFDEARVESYRWISPGDLVCNQCLQIGAAKDSSAIYVFEATTKEGCVYRDSVEILVAQVPYPNPMPIMDDTICVNAELAVSLDTLLPDWSVSWRIPGINYSCLECEGIKALLSEPDIVEVRVTNEFGCIGDTSVEVFVEKEIPDFLVNQRAVCTGNETQLGLMGAVTPIQWMVDGLVTCATCAEITLKVDKDHMVGVEVLSKEGCYYADTLLVEAVSQDRLIVPPDTLVCVGENVFLSASGPGFPEWKADDQIVSTSGFSAQLTASRPTDFVIFALYDECLLTDSIKVDVIAEIDAWSLGDTVCFGDLVELKVTGNALTYTWFKNDQIFAVDTLVSFPGDYKDEYYVVAERKGCQDLILPSALLVHPELHYQIVQRRIKMDLNEQVRVQADWDDEDRYTYTWTPEGGLSCVDCARPYIYGVNDPTIFYVGVADKTSQCSLVDSVSVRTSEVCSEKGFYRPNIISLHAGIDGNNQFAITSLDASEFRSLEIYDRWGERLFRTENPAEIWNGDYLGKKVSPGVFVYRVEAFCPETGEVYSFYGNVTVVD